MEAVVEAAATGSTLFVIQLATSHFTFMSERIGEGERKEMERKQRRETRRRRLRLPSQHLARGK